jgi:hypothetical protein
LDHRRSFYRLVDLDLRKREFVLTMRETNVRADRVDEMKQELVQIDDEIAALIAGHQNAAQCGEGSPINRLRSRALPLLGCSVWQSTVFQPPAGAGLEAPSTKVSEYVITDLGSFATVRSPKGQMYRCTLFGQIEGRRWDSLRISLARLSASAH